MHETPLCFHHLEWPDPGATVAGPIVWLRGWVVGKPGWDFTDIRARSPAGTHLGVLGLPRTDLAAHFRSPRAWLPAEFIVGVPLPDGGVTLAIDAQDIDGNWHSLQSPTLTVAPSGAPSPRIEGRVVPSLGGSWTLRGAHAPFDGHLDDPGQHPVVRDGRTAIFGWLLHDTLPLEDVLATSDLLVFNHLAHSLTDMSLAAKVGKPAASHARLRGEVDTPPTLDAPACLRVYARTADGVVHLCFAQRFSPGQVAPQPRATPSYRTEPSRSLPSLPSGRPRRLLLALRTLQPCDATQRAIDVARHLASSGRWAVRLVCAEDGCMRADCERAGLDTQFVDPQPLFDAVDNTSAEDALTRLGRVIWWGHLDAVAVFDPLCFWAITLARRHGLPVLFDCMTERPMQPEEGSSPAIRSLMLSAWRSATRVCLGSHAAAAAQAGVLGDASAEVIPQWHGTDLRPVEAPRVADLPAWAPVSPATAEGFSTLLRALKWIVHRHPMKPAWRCILTRTRDLPSETLTLRDLDNLPSGLVTVQPSPPTRIGACLNPSPLDGPVRALLDAATAGVPIITTGSPSVNEYFGHAEALLVPPDNPLALAHALLDVTADPAATTRRAAAARRRVISSNAPGPLLARWQALLETTAATGG